jgi:hypothetical protein
VADVSAAIGGGTTAGSMLSVNGDVGITGNLKVGSAELGNWPSTTNYAYFGHKALDHSAVDTYAVLQSSAGNTYINAAPSKTLFFRVDNGAQNEARMSWNLTHFNQGADNVDFRVDGDTVDHLLFVDAGNEVVGIGTDTSSLAGAATLTVNGDASITGLLAVSSAGIRFNDGTTQTTAGGGGGGISFNGSTANGVVTYGGSTADVEANLTFDGSTLVVNGDIDPNTDNNGSIGSASKIWGDLYVDDIHLYDAADAGSSPAATDKFLILNNSNTVETLDRDEIIYDVTVTWSNASPLHGNSTTLSVSVNGKASTGGTPTLNLPSS